MSEEELSAKEQLDALIAQQDALAAQKEQIRKLMQDITDQQNELNNKKYDLRNKIREEERIRAEAARREEERMRALQQQKELAKQTEYLDHLTYDAPWRDRAMKHQIDGAKYLAIAKRAICADGMGVGKTLQSLMWLDMIQAKRTLIVCPGDVVRNFAEEITRFTDRPVFSIAKMPFLAQQGLLTTVRMLENPVVIINYESWNRGWKIVDELIDMRFDSVILDEAHIVKETDGRPYQGASRIIFAENSCPVCHGPIAVNRNHYWECAECPWTSFESTLMGPQQRSVQYLLTMTGTPILNRPTELYSLLHLVDDKLYKSKNLYMRDFCKYNAWNGRLEWKFGAQGELANQISAFYLRRTFKDAGITIPPQTPVVHEIEFDPVMYPKQAKIMTMLRKQSQIEAAGKNLKIMDMLALLTRERQASVWPGGITLKQHRIDPETGNYMWDYNNTYKDGTPREVWDYIPVGDEYQESMKIDRAIGLIEQLNADGRRVVVFSQFKTCLAELHTRLGERSIRLDGDTSDDERELIKRNFNREYSEELKWDNVLCNYQTGGVGLNLTAATAIVVLDEEWNPGKTEQAYARINRIGQTEPTEVHILRLVSNISHIDEWMSKLIMAKADLIAGFTQATEEKSNLAMQMEEELAKILEGNWG